MIINKYIKLCFATALISSAFAEGQISTDEKVDLSAKLSFNIDSLLTQAVLDLYGKVSGQAIKSPEELSKMSTEQRETYVKNTQEGVQNFTPLLKALATEFQVYKNSTGEVSLVSRRDAPKRTAESSYQFLTTASWFTQKQYLAAMKNS